ncbi:phosphoglycerate mutase family protein [Aliikangiella sp. G2MR2-5]|uniref:phosphoglycerate mutase family protein n=1 Tax=Aliikangiella sp. G2MR2-5 TaxID=2788943 RepID=UPI0018A99745|nr:phosphoglycerate mutase family protein [Aliikangiella sp. G2MR2-5]
MKKLILKITNTLITISLGFLIITGATADSSQSSVNQVSATPDNNTFTLYFVRHAEKANEPKTDPELTVQGHERAKNLATMLSKTALSKIYSTRYQRTLQTAAVSADIKALVVTHYDPRQLKEFADKLLQDKVSALVVGHSNTTPTLIRLIGGKAENIDESRYGDLFQLIIDKSSLKVVATNLLQIPAR